MQREDDPYGTPYDGQPAAPPGYHYENGQLVPDAAPAGNWWETGGQPPASNANLPPLRPDQLYYGGEFDSGSWATGAPSNAPAGYKWDPNYANYVRDPNYQEPVIDHGPGPGPGPAPGPQAGTAGTGPAGSLSAIFQAPAERFDSGGWQSSMPRFAPPAYKPPPAFVEPDYEASLKDPGYMFEANEGRRRMEQGAAARGVLNGGGTLKDVNAWGQNFAAQRVNDVRNRAKDTYLLNYATQFTDPYQYAYRSALDSFTGGLSGWQTQGQVGQRQNETDWQHAYLPFNDLWNRQIQVALA